MDGGSNDFSPQMVLKVLIESINITSSLKVIPDTLTLY